MCIENLANGIVSMPLRVARQASNSAKLRQGSMANLLAILFTPERGCGQDKAMEMDQKGLAAARKQKEIASDPLEPSWGEPELLAALAWTNLHRTTPDLNAAQSCAQSALDLVPYWHYLKDILIPQIRKAADIGKIQKMRD